MYLLEGVDAKDASRGLQVADEEITSGFGRNGLMLGMLNERLKKTWDKCGEKKKLRWRSSLFIGVLNIEATSVKIDHRELLTLVGFNHVGNSCQWRS